MVILPLEDVLRVALLAAVQVYLQGPITGSFARDAVVALLLQDTRLANGRSRVPGFVTQAEDLESLLAPSSQGRTGIADDLVMLQAFDDAESGGPLLPLPESWVLPSAPLTRWPAFFKGETALLVYVAQVAHLLSGFADREMTLSARARIGANGDGCMSVAVACFRCAPASPAADPDAVGIGCPRSMLIELPLADLGGLALVRVRGAHAAHCQRSSLQHDVLPSVVEYAMALINADNNNGSVMASATVHNIAALAEFDMYSRGVREEGRIVPPPPRRTASGETTTNPLAPCRGRYGAAGVISAGYADASSLLPTCICNGSGDPPMVVCSKQDSCVWSYAGEFHKQCVLGRKPAPPGGFICGGCSAGAPPVVTNIMSHPAVIVSVCACVCGGGTSLRRGGVVRSWLGAHCAVRSTPSHPVDRPTSGGWPTTKCYYRVREPLKPLEGICLLSSSLKLSHQVAFLRTTSYLRTPFLPADRCRNRVRAGHRARGAGAAGSALWNIPSALLRVGPAAALPRCSVQGSSQACRRWQPAAGCNGVHHGRPQLRRP